jgi:hypothetical protein
MNDMQQVPRDQRSWDNTCEPEYIQKLADSQEIERNTSIEYLWIKDAHHFRIEKKGLVRPDATRNELHERIDWPCDVCRQIAIRDLRRQHREFFYVVNTTDELGTDELI